MTKDSHNEGSPGPEEPENDRLWTLLGKASKPEAGPFFARNVVREVRLLEDEHSSAPGSFWTSLFSLRSLLVGGTAAALAVAFLLVASNQNGTESSGNLASTTPPAVEMPVEAPPAESAAPDDASFDMEDYQDEIEMIDFFDELLAVQDVGSLDDEALAELLF